MRREVRHEERAADEGRRRADGRQRRQWRLLLLGGQLRFSVVVWVGVKGYCHGLASELRLLQGRVGADGGQGDDPPHRLD